MQPRKTIATIELSVIHSQIYLIYATILREIKTICTNITSEPYLPNFPCIILIGMEVINHIPNKHNTYISE